MDSLFISLFCVLFSPLYGTLAKLNCWRNSHFLVSIVLQLACDGVKMSEVKAFDFNMSLL